MALGPWAQPWPSVSVTLGRPPHSSEPQTSRRGTRSPYTTSEPESTGVRGAAAQAWAPSAGRVLGSRKVERPTKPEQTLQRGQRLSPVLPGPAWRWLQQLSEAAQQAQSRPLLPPPCSVFTQLPSNAAAGDTSVRHLQHMIKGQRSGYAGTLPTLNAAAEPSRPLRPLGEPAPTMAHGTLTSHLPAASQCPQDRHQSPVTTHLRAPGPTPGLSFHHRETPAKPSTTPAQHRRPPQQAGGLCLPRIGPGFFPSSSQVSVPLTKAQRLILHLLRWSSTLPRNQQNK